MSLAQPFNPDMPVERLLYATTPLTSTFADKTMTGTGFFYERQHGAIAHCFLVTNKHVIENALNVELVLTKSDLTFPILGEKIDISLGAAKSWHFHPNQDIDVAVLPIGYVSMEIEKINEPVYINFVDDTLLPTEQLLIESDAYEEVIFIGYPNGIYDESNLLPVVRRGTTATHIRFDYSSTPTFLIDASVFPGSSGSPVFLWNSVGYPVQRAGRPFLGRPQCILGIVSAVYLQDAEGRLEITSSPGGKNVVPIVPQKINLGIVYKTKAIVEAINDFLQKTGIS
jgi:hypothetical protein